MTTTAVNKIQQLRRRSGRMALNAKIGVAGEDRQKCSFTMPARATNLNRHGAAVQLHRELQIGSTVVIQNGRRTQASARVVTQISAVGGVFTYGVEFQEEDSVKNFWGITFPAQS
jgi:autotransporter translocation and assembly factor TamB